MANLVLGHVSPLSWTGFRDDVFGRLESEMDRLLTDMINPKSIQRMKGDNYPKTDISRQGHNLVFDLAVPFCKKENIKITLEDGTLTVTGDNISSDIFDGDTQQFIQKELRRGCKFQRSWSLSIPGCHERPDLSLSEDDIIAELKDGILTISIVDYFIDEEKKPVKKEIKIK